MAGTLNKLGIIAGGGNVPRQLIAACQTLGRPFHVICLEGHADPETADGVQHTWLPLGAGAKLKELFAAQGITDIVMIGRVRRPSMLELKPDWFTVKALAKIGMNALGDDGLLRAIGKIFEEEGVRVLGAHEVFADLLMPEGVLTQTQPDEDAQNDMRRGIVVAKALGQVDVGQSVIIQQGIVLGVEAVEGTDALMARCASLRREGPGPVLVKIAKPQQDNRFDLPTIGPETVAAAAVANIRGIAVQANRSLLVEKEKTLGDADANNIFVAGLSNLDGLPV